MASCAARTPPERYLPMPASSWAEAATRRSLRTVRSPATSTRCASSRTRRMAGRSRATSTRAVSPAGGNVNGGFPKVCSPACPAGTTCSNGYCATQDIAMVPCGNGTPCGANCCLQGEACTNGACAASPVGIACPADHPVQCGANGPCCPAGFGCSGGACLAPLASTHTGPQGPPCANGYCDTGLSCGGGALCCPLSTPQACGSACCTVDETCSSGQCGCPAGETSCGTACCPSGSVCKNGACEPACANGEFCGGFCCTA